MLLLSWEESLRVLALHWLLQSLAGNPEVFPLHMIESLVSDHFSLPWRWFSLIPSLALNQFLKWTFPSQPLEPKCEHCLCRHKKRGKALQLGNRALDINHVLTQRRAQIRNRDNEKTKAVQLNSSLLMVACELVGRKEKDIFLCLSLHCPVAVFSLFVSDPAEICALSLCCSYSPIELHYFFEQLTLLLCW